MIARRPSALFGSAMILSRNTNILHAVWRRRAVGKSAAWVLIIVWIVIITLVVARIVNGPGGGAIPFPAAVGLLLAALAALLAHAWYSYDRPRAMLHRQIDRMNHGHCPECGYDLTGNESGVCPECGEDFSSLRLLSRQGAKPRH